MPTHPAAPPLPADPAAAARLLADFAAIGPAEARALRHPRPAGTPGGTPGGTVAAILAAILAAIGGGSPYLSDLALRESRTLRAVAALGPGAVVDAALRDLAATPPQTPRPRIAATLRQAKRRAALAIAAADLAGLWGLDQVTGALSGLADATLGLATAHLLWAAHDRGELRLPDPGNPARGSGFTVLGMGKLGAGELNYSSDVDLILLYDAEAHAYHEDGLSGSITRIARQLVILMEARDADGYVFRTDLRLRPDPAATPPAVSLLTALTYYESLGQNWERAAMIKARPLAGDLELGARFLREIRPFVWRRHLDFAAIADLHAMKRRIDAHKGGSLAAGGDPVERLLGHDLKLGSGGIREIEFIAQTLQLVWAGRNPMLRSPRTLRALRRMAASGHLPRRAAAELIQAYRCLRIAEHRLQMVADRQTHALPATREEFARFAVFLGFPDAGSCAGALLCQIERVRARYTAFFEERPHSPDDAASPAGSDPVTPSALRAMGFSAPERVAATLRDWQAGLAPALRTVRARSLLEQILPHLLPALARQAEPDQVFERFDAFLQRLPAGVQVLSLFAHRPALLERIAAVLGAAPMLADHLALVPSALEGLLAEDDVDPNPATSLATQLRDARGLEDAITITRRFLRGEEFRLSVATLEDRLDVDAAGAARSALADAVVAALLDRVLTDHAARNGVVPGGAMVVVALGRAGAREMLAGSDLDLMLIYDHPPETGESTGGSGGRAVSASKYYIRAAHAFIAALTAPGAEGPLYAVDMRLRPSGNKGPVAVSLPAFERYHRESAWTWERMALTRARVIAGDAALAARVRAAITAALCRPEPAETLRRDACAMRARLARDLPASGPWDGKLRAGGLMDIAFMVQVLQLQHAPRHPEVLDTVTLPALRRLQALGAIGAEDAALLARADRSWRSVQGILRITMQHVPSQTLPPATAQALLRALAPGLDLPALARKLDAMADQVRALFVRVIGDAGSPAG